MYIKLMRPEHLDDRFYVRLPEWVEHELPVGLELELCLIEATKAFESNDAEASYAAVFLGLLLQGFSTRTAHWLTQEAAVRAAVASIPG